MLLDENYDADEILKEPDEDDLFDDLNEEEVEELNFSGHRSFDDADISLDEEDLFS